MKTKFETKHIPTGGEYLGQRIRFHGSELLRSTMSHKCWHCGSVAKWIDINFEAAFCSEECSDAKWEEYFKACYPPCPYCESKDVEHRRTVEGTSYLRGYPEDIDIDIFWCNFCKGYFNV